MLGRLDAAANRFLNNLARISARFDRAQAQVSSGLRLTRPSDEPDRVSQLLQTRAQLSRTEQTSRTLARASAEATAAERAIDQSVRIMDRVRMLAAQAASSTSTTQDRLNIVAQLETALASLVQLSRTTSEGRYVFSGDNETAAPYTLDFSLASPISAYNGGNATRQVLLPNGGTLAVTRTAQEIFDNPVAGNNVFGSLLALRTALLTDDEPGLATAVQNLRSATDHLHNQQVAYGNVQRRISDAIDEADAMSVQLKAAISTLEDADITQAIVELNQAAVQRETALAGRAKQPMTSLFDYLR